MQINEPLLDVDVISGSRKSLIDLFIRRTAVLTSTPENITEKIIKDQWNQANKALMSDTSIGQVDFCNLGTFSISLSKANKRLDRIAKIEAQPEKEFKDEVQRKRYSDIMNRNKELIRSIKLKTKQTDQKQETNEY